MEQPLRFDVALSYAGLDSGIAGDLFNLIARSGLSVFSYAMQRDQAAGFLRSRLMDIYADSVLNVVLWSREYAAAQGEDIVAMERRCIIHRHVEKGQAESLLLIRIDREPLDRGLDMILAHDLRASGVLATSRLIQERLRALTAGRSEEGAVIHPAGTEGTRTTPVPCRFSIRADYQSDPLGRWKALADVLVDFPNPLHTEFVYLIPSAACSPLLRHTAILKTQPDLLERKRRATEQFVAGAGGKSLPGFWFSQRVSELEHATLYAAAYDRALNASLSE